MTDHMHDAAQPKQETDWLGEAARWANRAYDMKCALDKAANRFRELGYIDFANDCLAAQPPAAPVDGEKAAKDYEHGYNDGIEWAQTHGRSSAGSGEPFAWVCELAHGLRNDGQYYDWREWITKVEPRVPDRSIRNLRPLYLNEPQGACICQDQHRRGYCTEPGCPYSLTRPHGGGQ